jgi:hypothetical protein
MKHRKSSLVVLVMVSIGFARVAYSADSFDAFLARHCIQCHGPQKEEGDIRFDTLSRDFKAGVDTHHWAEALEKVNSGEMPPQSEQQPTQQEIAEFVTQPGCQNERGPGCEDGSEAISRPLSVKPKGISEHGL